MTIMVWTWLVVLVSTLMVCQGQNLLTQTCSSDNTAEIQQGATAWLGGIISLNEQGSDGYGCGEFIGSMQAYEAIRWVLDLLNKKGERLNGKNLTDHYVPGIKLGMHVRNYCGNTNSAVAAVSELFPQISSNDCSETPDEARIGIIGASTSADTYSILEATLPFDIPVVSYEATAPQITTSRKFYNFQRSIAPDGPLAEVIVKILQELKWEYIVVVYDKGTYGRETYAELHSRLVAADICTTAGIMVDTEDTSDDNVQDVLNQVVNTGATGVIFVGSLGFPKPLIKTANNKLSGYGKLQWLFVDFPLYETFDDTVYQRGIISVTAASRKIVEVEDHWIKIDPENPSPENPWFKAWYEKQNDCEFSPANPNRDCDLKYPNKTPEEIELEKRKVYQQDQWTESAVMSVFTYARALKQAQQDKCNNVPGLCENLRKMSRKEFIEDYLKKVDFTFTGEERVPSLASNIVEPYNAAKTLKFNDIGDVEDPSYFIWNYNNVETGAGDNIFKFRMVGSYINSYLNLNLKNVAMYDEQRTTKTSLAMSPCPALGCYPCLGLPADLKYYYDHGDIVVNGIFTLHEMGQSPLTCGMLSSPNRAMYLEAMIYALREVNSANVLRGIKLGGLGMDDCSSAVLSQAFISEIQRGNLIIEDKNTGDILDPRTVEAYTGGHTSPLTIPLASLMNTLETPLIGYRAGSSELDNRMMYPYYIRSLAGIQEEIQAIILLLKKFNWMYVQLVVSHEHYSTDAEQVFRRLAAEAGICVLASHDIGMTNADINHVPGHILMTQNSAPVISLLEHKDNQRLVQALMTISAENREKIALIGTTTFGTLEEFDGNEAATMGVITLRPRHSTLNGFWAYLSQLRVGTHTSNPWFEQWYSEVFDCTLTNANNKVPCDTSRPITEAPKFKEIFEVESVINGIQAIARGLNEVLEEYCSVSYTSVCTAFINANDKGEKLLEEILRVSYRIPDTSPAEIFSFVGKSAAIPFEVFNFVQDGGDYRLVKIADVNPWTKVLALSINRKIRLYNEKDTNDFQRTCSEPCLPCLYMFNYLKYWYKPGDFVVGAIVDAHYAGDGPFTCSNLRVNGAIYSQVFDYAIRKFNALQTGVLGLQGGLKLGSLVFDGCTNPTRSKAVINRVHTGIDIMDSSGNMLDSSDIVSWLTYDSQTTIDVAHLLQQLDLSIVSPGATSPTLDDKTKFTTFFRTSPTGSLVARGMAEFINKMGWKYVVTINTPDRASRESRDVFREYLATFGICITSSYEFETDGNMDVITRSISNAETRVVALFWEDDVYIQDLIKTVGGFSFVFSFVSNNPFGDRLFNSYQTALSKSVFFEQENSKVSDFIDYLDTNKNSLRSNPWFDDIYEELFTCNLPGSYDEVSACQGVFRHLEDSEKWQDYVYTLSTINAVWAIGNGIHQTLVEKCGGGYTSVCPSFVQDSNTQQILRENMDTEVFTDVNGVLFDFIERESNRGFDFKRFNQTNVLTDGKLDHNGVLQLSSELSLKIIYSSVKSECSSNCLVCQTSTSDFSDYTYIEGDVLIVGIFDVHKQGETPYTCGALNDKHGLPLLEAFNYAVEVVNNKTDPRFSQILNSLSLGAIAFDMCQSPTRAANLVSNFHSGTVKLVLDGGRVINPSHVDAYIATMDTESSLRVADVLSRLSIPQISYGATGLDLLDSEDYKFFLRSVPADDKQARAVISYLRKFGYNNIQLISSFDEIGRPGMKEFKRLALVNRICVDKTFTLDADPNASPSQIVQRIVSNGNAQVVVLWMKNPLPVLEEVSKNSQALDNILYIATDKWGADPDYLKLDSIRPLLLRQHLVILDVETADIHGFDEYLVHKTPDNYKRNPWFKDYIETFQGCRWGATDGTACDTSRTIPRWEDYVQDPYVLYVINSVYSAALAIHKSLEEKCLDPEKNRYEGVCNLYRNDGKRKERVMRNLLEVRFEDDTHQPYFYTEDRQSDRGFHIYNVSIVEGTANTFFYENIGHYNDSHFLKLDIQYKSTYDAVCNDVDSSPGKDTCICEFPEDLPSRYMKKADGGRGLSLVYVGDIHKPNPSNKFSCGPINTGVDLQRLLAFFYAIDRINANLDGNVADSIRLDGVALDSCGNSLRLGQDVYNILSANKLCDSDDDGQIISPSTILAFIADKDRNAIPISNMVTDRGIITISPTAGSQLLDDKFNHPYFLRIPGGFAMMSRTILQTANQMGWDTLSVIYTNTMAHQEANKAFIQTASDEGRQMCVTDSVPLNLNATLEEARDAVERISRTLPGGGVVLFVEPAHQMLILQAIYSLNIEDNYVWIVPGGWGKDFSNIYTEDEDLRNEAVGSLIIESRSAILEDFDNYVKSLRLNNRGGIPDDWFEEIYETLHQCSIVNLENPSGFMSTQVCEEDLLIADKMPEQDPSVLHTIMSVYSVALGLNNIVECRQSNLDISACLQDLDDEKSEIVFRNIRSANFRVLPELLGSATFPFSFDEYGNGLGGFLIKNVQSKDGSTVNVGEYNSQGLTLQLDRIRTAGPRTEGQSTRVNTTMSSNCLPGTECLCQLPYGHTWSYRPVGFQSLSNVKVGERYKDPKTDEIVQVSSIPSVSDRFEDTWAIIVTVLAVLGVCISLGIFVYLLVMYPVRGGTSILGFILCFGIVLLYLMVLPFVAHADQEICGLRRFGLGFVYAIVYSSLLVKLVDCWRIRGKADSYDAKYSKLGRPAGLFMVVVFFVLVQVMINTEWLILEPPMMERVFYNNIYWPRCVPDDFYDESLVLSLVYIMALIFVSFILGIITFTSDKNHKESRWILGIMILSIPTWVVWTTVATIGDLKVRDPAVAIGLLVNATFILLLVPVRKIYLLQRYNKWVGLEDEEDEKSRIADSTKGGSDYRRQYNNNPRFQYDESIDDYTDADY